MGAAAGVRRGRRDVLLLALCQGLFLCTAAIAITVSGLVGERIAPSPEWATVPYGLLAVITALATVPMSLLMGRIGRARGFALGGLSGAAGGGLAAIAIVHGDFALFCLGNALLGIFQASALYYRFAAAEAVAPAERDQAIAWVLAGGLLAAFVGPRLGAWSRDLLPLAVFAGSFAIASMTALAAAATAAALRIPAPPPVLAGSPSGRAVGTIVRQPVFVVGVLNALAGYAVMAFVMTATPLAVIGCGYGIGAAADVIQWHIVGMFAPSFITGHLIGRFGVARVLLAGAALLVASAAVAVSGIALWQFTLALVMLGVGWNFTYVGGTSLITRAHAPEERARTQAVSELLVFGTVALATVGSGGTLAGAGWSVLNLITVPLILIAATATGWLAATGRLGGLRARPA